MIGFVNVNKPKGITSAHVVAKVKRALGLAKNVKVGHTGTLDPEASGVLPIAVGKATKLFEFMLSKTKEYEANFTFGYETDTLDSAGKKIYSSDKIPQKSEIETKLNLFLGSISQMPPVYSAKSVGGVRAYTLARQGKSVDLQPSVVQIDEFRLIEQIDERTFRFKIVCGSGTYIRSLCRDLAYKLDTYATMTDLVRTRVGVFDLSNAVGLDSISNSCILPCEVVLEKLDTIEIDSTTLERLRCGQKVMAKTTSAALVKVHSLGRLVGLATCNGELKMKIWLE